MTYFDHEAARMGRGGVSRHHDASHHEHDGQPPTLFAGPPSRVAKVCQPATVLTAGAARARP